MLFSPHVKSAELLLARIGFVQEGGFYILILNDIFTNVIALCGKISSIENGQVVVDGVLEGDEIRFLCDQNYILVGEKVIKCMATGKWNASEPKCKGNRKRFSINKIVKFY